MRSFASIVLLAVTVATQAAAVEAQGTPQSPNTLTAIRREVLPEALRVTLELARETVFREERLEGPPRVFVDLTNTAAVDALKDASVAFPDDVVRQIRIGRQPGARTRVVLDLQGAARHSVYALYNPFRVVIDIERAPTDVSSIAPTSVSSIAPPSVSPVAPTSVNPVAPAAPNKAGGFSLSRQLGLHVARIVIDPGHGGHDPGAKGQGLNEADLVMDVAVRLEKLLLKQPGVDVVLTRRGNVSVPLEQRTEVANRAGADLFLSIHANASATRGARGIETYFLNFAPTPEAEAIAARENAGSARPMHNLPDIVRAIATNNKIDESRDFAFIVQEQMYARLRRANRGTRSLGVKQAPFMVLIGATMPSALAEIAFVTNPQEAKLLRTASYRQQIADALLNGIMRYQNSLKASPGTLASQ